MGLFAGPVLLTGGIAVVNQNDFDKGIKRIDAETSDYYLIGFVSNNPDPLKRSRRLEVKVLRDGMDVRIVNGDAAAADGVVGEAP